VQRKDSIIKINANLGYFLFIEPIEVFDEEVNFWVKVGWGISGTNFGT